MMPHDAVFEIKIDVLLACLFFVRPQVKRDMEFVSTFTEVRTEAHHPVVITKDENPMAVQMSGDSPGESPSRKVPTLLSPGNKK